MRRRTGRFDFGAACAAAAGALCVAAACGCGNDAQAPAAPVAQQQRKGEIPEGPPSVPGRAEVPADLGSGHVYDDGTLGRFRNLLRAGAWRLAAPPRNAQGMLVADHVASGLRFVLVPAGRFRMGAESGGADERPVREIAAGAFLIAQTECTQDAWDRIGGTDERARKAPELPIDSVSWDDAKAWCGKAGLRLPTEAEWEYACRAGTTSDWSFGSDASRIAAHATYVENSGGGSCGTAAREPNPWGLRDCHGNLYEWCEDVHHASYEGAPNDAGAWTAPTDVSYRVLRGGAWNETPWKCRSSARTGARPGFRFFILGFRPAASLP